MSLKKDVIGAEVQIGTNQAQASLVKLAQETSTLTNENDRLRISQAKLKALGKESAEEYKKVTKAISENNKTVKENKAQMDALRKTIGLTEMSFPQLRKRAAELRKELLDMGDSADPVQFNKLNSELISTERQMGKLKGRIGETHGVMGKMESGLKSMPGALGGMAAGIISVGKATMAFFLTPVGAILGIVAAVVMGVKALISNSIEFGKAASSLSAITGAVGKDLDFLKKKAREISKDSTQSATDMLNAFKTIGGAMPELLKNGPLLAEVTKNAVALSESSGGELSITEAAKAAAAALNQFNIPLTESARAVNALAAGSEAGAAEVDNITESLKNLGPVASNANMSLENTIAAIEVVAEKGILGAEAGTKLRGVILKLQSESLGYASGQFKLKDAMDEANKTIDAQGTAMEKDAYLAKLFGIENVTVGKIMLDNVDKYEALTTAVTGTNTAFDQARIQQDNQSASNKKFGNAWSNMMLSIEDGNGILARSWKWIVDGATWLINEMTVQFENLGASIRAIGIVFTNFYEQIKSPLESLGRLLKAVFTFDYADIAPAFDAFKSSLSDIGKDGSLNLGKIALEQLKIGAASKAATAEIKRQKKELEDLAKAGGGDRTDKKTNKESSDKALAILDEANNERMARLTVQYEKEAWSDDKFKSEQMAAELAYLIQKQALLEQFGQSTIQVEAQISQKRVEAQKTLNAILLEGDKELIKQMEEDAKADDKAIQESIKNAEKTTKSLEKSKDNEQKLLEDRQKNYLEFGQAAGETFAALMLDNEATMADYLKATLLLALEALHQVLLIEEAKAIVKGIEGGPVGIGIAIAKVAAMELAYNAVKGLLSANSKQEGGFSNTGPDSQPDGIYHKNEFIASAPAVRNPTIKPFLDIIDMAQRSGTVRSLNLSALVQSGRQGGGYAGSSSASSSSPVLMPGSGSDPALRLAIDRLNANLEKGIRASINKYGVNGLDEGMNDITDFKSKVFKK